MWIAREKRGQLALAIVLGVILLALIVTLFVGRSISFDQDHTTERRTLSAVPDELEPLREYTEKCLYDISLEALQRAATQGGYVEPRRFDVQVGALDQTAGDGLQFSPHIDIIIPYWYYMSSDNDCREQCFFGTRQPPLEGDEAVAVTSQVADYVEREIGRCLKDFAPLRDRGFDLVVEGQRDVEVVFGKSDVYVLLEYPVMAENEGQQMRIHEYQARLEVPFRHMYDYAALITAAAERYHFLERHVLEIISVYSGLEKDKLPPQDASTFEFVSTMFWLRSEVEDQLQGLLTSYVPMLKVRNSRNYQPYVYEGQGRAAPGIQRMYDNMILPIENPGYDDLAVDFQYLSWPYYFNINSKGEIIRPDSISIDFLPFFGFQQFRNLYDVSFPTKIDIHSDEALNGQGFTFSFALESNIRNSEPMRVDFNQTEAESPVQDDTSIFCDLSQRNSGEIMFDVSDGTDGEPVEDVAVMYSCGDLSCPVVVTGPEGKVNESFPICSGGVLTLMKQGYASKYELLSTRLDLGEDLGNITLEPMRTRRLVIEKVPVVKSAGAWQVVPDQKREMDPGELAVVTFTQVTDVGEPEVFTRVIESAGPDVIYTMDLLPGLYEVKVDMMNKQGLTVEPDKRSMKGKSYMIPEETLEIDMFLSGGLRADERTGYMQVDKAMLDAHDTLVLRLVGIDLYGTQDLKIEDLDQMNKVTEYSRQFRSLLDVEYADTGWASEDRFEVR